MKYILVRQNTDLLILNLASAKAAWLGIAELRRMLVNAGVSCPLSQIEAAIPINSIADNKGVA